MLTNQTGAHIHPVKTGVTGNTPGDLAGFTPWNTGAGLSWNRMEVPKTVILISAG